MNLNKKVDVDSEQIFAIVGKRFPISINDEKIEVPDNLSQTDLDKINAVLYPDQVDWETKLSALPISSQTVWRKLLQRLGELP